MTIAVASSEPLIAGRSYMVPCVYYPWFGREDWWPVIGPRHNDKRFLNFAHQHYHIDGRFLTKRQVSFAIRVGGIYQHSLPTILAHRPLNSRNDGDPSPTPTVKRRKCTSAYIPYGAHGQKVIIDLAAHYAGRKCRSFEQGWVCPHQQTPLGSIKPIDGVVTCPLHGLRIDHRTGIVLSPGGSKDTVRRAREAGVEVMEVEE